MKREELHLFQQCESPQNCNNIENEDTFPVIY